MNSEFAYFKIAWMAAKNDTEQRKVLFKQLVLEMGLVDTMRAEYPHFGEHTAIEFRAFIAPNLPVSYRVDPYDAPQLVFWRRFGNLRNTVDRNLRVTQVGQVVIVAYAPEIDTLFVDERGALEYE